MKLKLVAFSVLSLSAVSTFIPGITNKASAVCVLTDVGVQVAVHSRGTVAHQNNNVNQQASKNCYNNSVTSTGVQVYTGTGSVNQNRNSSQYVSGGSNPTGIYMPAIRVPVQVQVDVPAYPKF